MAADPEQWNMTQPDSILGKPQQQLGARDVGRWMTDACLEPVDDGQALSCHDRVAGMEIAMAQTISHRQVIKDVKLRTFQCVRDMRGLDASKQRVALENEMVFAGVLVDLCVPLGQCLSDANWRKGLRLSSTRRVGRSRSSNMMPHRSSNLRISTGRPTKMPES